jgi:D-sedoheptulose 7-phosphate isomerase
VSGGVVTKTATTREETEGRVVAALHEARDVHDRLGREVAGAVAAAAERIREALAAGGKVLVFGNGGSAAEAQHFAAELSNRFQRERRALAGLALTTDTSVLTSVANDYGFEHVFARQVEALGAPGDVAVAISTSGRSPNVLAGARCARERGLAVVALTGGDGGELGPMADVHLNVAHPSVARTQEAHLTLLHIVCELVEREPGATAAGTA